MIVGVVGAKQADRDDIAAFLETLFRRYPQATVVSDGVGGGASAELAWLDLGGKVVSFRALATPVNGSYLVQKWEIEAETPLVSVISTIDPTFADFGSARLYAQMQVAEFCDRMVVFQRDDTPETDTAITAGFAVDQGKGVYVYTPAQPFRRKAA